jgi:hypothetical protein
VLQFKTEIMPTPAFWHYNTEQEAMAAEQRLNPPRQCNEAKLNRLIHARADSFASAFW